MGSWCLILTGHRERDVLGDSAGETGTLGGSGENGVNRSLCPSEEAAFYPVEQPTEI